MQALYHLPAELCWSHHGCTLCTPGHKCVCSMSCLYTTHGLLISRSSRRSLWSTATFGSVTPDKASEVGLIIDPPPVPQVRGSREAMTVQDWAAQRCTISYRAPELFNVESHCIIDARTDIWVGLIDHASAYLLSLIRGCSVRL